MGSLRWLLAVGALAVTLGIIPSIASGANDSMYLGALSGAAEVPPVRTSATGTAYLRLNAAATQLRYAVSYSGLSGPLVAARVEVGPANAPGVPVFALRLADSTMFGSLMAADLEPSTAAPTWDAALDALREGRLYVNLLTAAHGNGEVRARLVASPGTLAAEASGGPSASTGSATPATPATSSTAPSQPPGSAAPAASGSPGPSVGAGAGFSAAVDPTPAATAAPAPGPATTASAGIDPIPIVVVVVVGLLGFVLATALVPPGPRPRRS